MPKPIQNAVFAVVALLAALALANLFSALFLAVYYRAIEGDDARWSLPAYADHDEAKAVFAEMRDDPIAYRPFVGWGRGPYAGRYVTVGADGHRVTPPNPANRPDAKVVGFFGGSAIWGEGVQDAETVPALFDSRTTQYASRNFGETGFNGRQDLDAFVNVLNDGTALDVAVFYSGANDVASLCRVDASANGHGMESRMGAMLAERSLLAEPFKPAIVLLTRLVRGAAGDAARTYDCDTDPAKAERVARTILNNWRSARVLARSRDMRFLAVLQPVAYFGAPRTDSLDLDPVLGRQFEAVYPRVKAALAAPGARSWGADLGDLYDGDTPLYVDWCHVSGPGNRRAAEWLVRLLGG